MPNHSTSYPFGRKQLHLLSSGLGTWLLRIDHRVSIFNVAWCLLLATGPNFPIPSQAVLPHGGTGQCVNHSGGCGIVMSQQAQRSEGWPNPGYMGNVCVGPLKVGRNASLGWDEATGLAWLEVLAELWFSTPTSQRTSLRSDPLLTGDWDIFLVSRMVGWYFKAACKAGRWDGNAGSRHIKGGNTSMGPTGATVVSVLLGVLPPQHLL